VRPLVRQAIPVVRELRPSVTLVNRADPDLLRTVKVLNYVVNELAYNPPGTEEGYLFWLAWFAHNASSILSIEDAHGAAWRGLVMVGCSTAGEVIKVTPALAPLGQSAACPGAGNGLPPLPKRGGR
jgi:phospholipid/cholesterol/gamma-HCH transport system substrate-binding protein